MRNSYLTKWSPSLSFIAWILIGLMVCGSLVNYLAGPEASGICVELRVLELEDDRVDVLDIAYIPASGHLWTCCVAFPGDLLLNHSLDVWSAEQSIHFERGPPPTNV